LIRQNIGAEKAFEIVMFEWSQRFAHAPQAMLRERVGDLKDVEIRVLTLLLDLPDHDPVDLPKGANAILVTHDLTPSLTVQLDRTAIAAIATDTGTRTSHVAILARSLGLPAIVGLRTATQQLNGRETAILDGSTGLLAINPSHTDIDAYRERARQEALAEEELKHLAALDAVTTDDVRITLRANVDLPEEADLAATSGAEGVGLMRTEFLVVGPRVDARRGRAVPRVQAGGRSVRGASGRNSHIRHRRRQAAVGGFPTEPNPFLGWRAIRMCLDQPEIFGTQLRALLRAAVHGNVHIMLPLVVTVDEVRAARKLLDKAAADLERRGVPFRRDVPLGVMIETPAAAVACDTFVNDVAFFSIGTNDLVQYTLAVDRGNANLASRFTPLHPAVLKLIRRTVFTAKQHGIDVAVCGEMASQPLMAFALIGLGVRQLSVAPRSVPLVKRIVRGISVEVAEEAANSAAAKKTAAEAGEELRRRLAGVMVDEALFADGLPTGELGSSL
jgi:phosphotransferase system enzyme I (PtsI)